MGINQIDKETLKKKLLEYDKKYGIYPENEYEGLSFYEFIFDLNINTKDWEEQFMDKKD